MPTRQTRSRRGRAAPLRRSADRVRIIGIVVLAIGLATVAWALLRAGTVRSGPKQWSSPPPMAIDVSRRYLASVKMRGGGEFVIELFADKAPLAVNNFAFLAGQRYYDGVTFHRVLEGFMAQTGDPTGTGAGGPGYVFANEDNDLRFDKAGVVAMANAGRDTNGSQFFITFGPQERLTGGYTIFGQVVTGMEVVQAISARDPEQNPTYAGDAIESIRVIEE